MIDSREMQVKFGTWGETEGNDANAASNRAIIFYLAYQKPVFSSSVRAAVSKIADLRTIAKIGIGVFTEDFAVFPYLNFERVFILPFAQQGWKVKNRASLLAGVSPVYPFGESRFYRFERHFGDDNDNSISEIIVEACSKQDAFDRLPTLDTDNREGLDLSGLETRFGYTVDGDVDSLLESWTEYPDKADTDAESEDDYIENYGRPIHQSWYLSGQYRTDADAQADRSTYHADYGILYLESN